MIKDTKQEIKELDAIINLYKDDAMDGLRNKIWAWHNNLITKQREGATDEKAVNIWIFTCPKCNKRVIRLPLTNYRENGKLYHIPSFGKAKCLNCGWESKPYGEGLLKTSIDTKQE